MSRKNIIIIASIVVITLIAGYFFFLKSDKTVESSTALLSVPPSSPLIISINNPIDFADEINSNELFETLKTIPSLNNEFKVLNDFKHLIESNEQIQKIIKGKNLILSFNISGKEDVNLLTLINLTSNSEIDMTERILDKFKGQEGFQINERKYNKVIINEISKDKQNYYVAIHKGIVMISQKSLLVEEAIRQTEMDLAQEIIEIKPLLKTIGNQSDIQIFINHSQIDRLLSSSLSKQTQKRSALLKIYSGWSELDLNIKDNKLLLSGFSNGNSENNYFGNTLLNQQPVNSNIDKVLPLSTAYFLNLSLSDPKTFFTDYESFLEKRNLYFQRKDQFKKLADIIGIDLQEAFLQIVNQDITLASINVDQNNATDGRVFILDTKSGSTALNKILEIQKAYIDKKALQAEVWQKDYEIDNQTSFTIYRFPIKNAAQVVFGQLFNGVETNWVTMYGNYLIFGDTFRTVAKAVHANVLGETLSGSLEFDKFKSNLNSRSNLNFYCNIASALPIAGLLFNNEIANEINSNDNLRKFKAFAWQITSTGEMLYNNSCLQYSSVIKSKPQTIWQSHISASFDCKPKFVINHTDPNNKEIVLWDNDNNFYLINNVGRVIWQIKLDGPIIGDINQIDYFKNGKLQYVFNTENKLYVVDRNGNSVKNFPVNFRAKATNQVAIFDYDNNLEYRFFVACADQKLYAYDKEGNVLKGWNTYKTDHIVTQPLQHFRVEGKDYIVASDKMKDYILHRVGTIRVVTKDVYAHSNNPVYLEERTSNTEPRIVTTDTQGALHYTYFDGKHETATTEKQNETHYFVAENLDADEAFEYIFADENQLLIQDNNGKQILKKKFDQPITHTPHVYSFSAGIKKIGITCKAENKIYLMEANGNLHPGFPLDGCTEFSIGFISSEMSNFNLLVGSPESYLYNYYIE